MKLKIDNREKKLIKLLTAMKEQFKNRKYVFKTITFLQIFFFKSKAAINRSFLHLTTIELPSD